MSAQWEPLTAAEEVVDALKACRRVEYQSPVLSVFRRVKCCDLPLAADCLAMGFRFRALVEGGA